MFSKENRYLSFTYANKHKIRTTKDIPILAKTYRYPHIYKQEVQTQIDEMLENEIIRHNCSLYSPFIWTVPKKLKWKTEMQPSGGLPKA